MGHTSDCASRKGLACDCGFATAARAARTHAASCCCETCLQEIEANFDGSQPYYVRHLIAALRSERLAASLALDRGNAAWLEMFKELTKGVA